MKFLAKFEVVSCQLSVLSIVSNYLKSDFPTVNACMAYGGWVPRNLGAGAADPGFSLQFFLWESLGLLQPKVEGPEVKVGDPMVSIEQRTRTKAVLKDKL